MKSKEIALPTVLPTRWVELRLGRRVVYLSREEAIEIADALRKAAHDG